MFFHHDNLKDYREEISNVLNHFFEEESQEGGLKGEKFLRFNWRYAKILNRFRDVIIPRLKTQIESVNKEIESEHIFKNVKAMVSSEFSRRMTGGERLATEEQEFEKGVEELYSLHAQILPILEGIGGTLQSQALKDQWGSHTLGRNLKKLADILSKIHTLSLRIAKVMKGVLRDLSVEIHEVNKKRHQLKQSERNFKSWIRLAKL